MASIRIEARIAASPEHVWSAVRDYGAVHRRLAPGFVTDTRLDGDARIVTFASGVVARERIVDVDDEARRLVWTAVGGRLTHHNGSLQVLAEAAGASRLLWIADLLPHDLKDPISGIMEQGMGVMKRTLEAGAVTDATRAHA